MVMEVPVRLLGQNIFNVTTSSATPVVLITSGSNSRGVILRTCIIAPVSGGFPGNTGQLFADINIGGGFVPPPPPPGSPSSTRYILVTDSNTGAAQLAWPFYLDPGLGLAFNPAPGGTNYNIYATWDYASLEAA